MAPREIEEARHALLVLGDRSVRADAHVVGSLRTAARKRHTLSGGFLN
jgi:hypothetical protein